MEHGHTPPLEHISHLGRLTAGSDVGDVGLIRSESR